MKEKTKNVLSLLAIIVVGIILGCNMYETSFYSYSWGTVKMLFSYEDISKITCSYFDEEGEYIVLEYETEEELMLWEDFLLKLKNTTFEKNASLFGRSFTGMRIEIELKNIQDDFIMIFANETRVAFGHYSWNSSEEIKVPVEWPGY